MCCVGGVFVGEGYEGGSGDHPMATGWGLGFRWYLYMRNHGKGEDYRYRAMSKRGGRVPLLRWW